ncbi:hypothetical protein AYO21_01546 [Fonsecaea monophora]|uniref:ATPase inhibitor, mitochondrial n=2 Tax=Fonsecaea TaxID=40354 RepID=A0A0D2GQM8_9EURO|nr:uncharacterized protein Z517_11504 [Fonsecaea pedrosoi CBS 271.37]XP_022516041.1 hypothetical protein AYO21_01546 [Fonsecaea monophora]KAH0835324.1 ATPase inhibitor, mitochondrial [Fonsecaea pedrosoi]KIW74734.1 hypothetical protein Z517_11504 [Fonsecaea pedrosoi CBS 271.37]OAG44089.1 hypothetical protein AYO21_01546 [Fonsecaea monophora]
MLRTQAVKLARASAAPSIRRSFSITAMRASEGDTGGLRSGGSAAGDAFTRREQASETKFIREKEMESLRKLKEKLAQQRKHLDELDEHIQELERDAGGEDPQHTKGN